jgi:hypothetical protein
MCGTARHLVRRASNGDTVWRSDTEKRAVSCLLDQSPAEESLSWDDLDAFMGHRGNASQKMRGGGHAKTPLSSKSSKSASAASTAGSGRRWFEDDKGDEIGRPRPASTSASSMPSRRARAQSWGNHPMHSNNNSSSNSRSDNEIESHDWEPDHRTGGGHLGAMHGKSWAENRRRENEHSPDGPWHAAEQAHQHGRKLYTSAGCRTDELHNVARRRSNSMYDASGNTNYLFNAPSRLLSSLSNEQQTDFQTQQLLFNSKHMPAPNSQTQHHQASMSELFGNEWNASQQHSPYINSRTSLMLARTYCAAKHIELEAPRFNHLLHMPMSAMSKTREKSSRSYTGTAPGESCDVTDYRERPIVSSLGFAARAVDGSKMARDYGALARGQGGDAMRHQHNDAGMYAQTAALDKHAHADTYTQIAHQNKHTETDTYAQKRDALSLRRPNSSTFMVTDVQTQKRDALSVGRSRSSISLVQVDKLLECDSEYVLPRRSKGFTGCSGKKRELDRLSVCQCVYVCGILVCRVCVCVCVCMRACMYVRHISC